MGVFCLFIYLGGSLLRLLLTHKLYVPLKAYSKCRFLKLKIPFLTHPCVWALRMLTFNFSSQEWSVVQPWCFCGGNPAPVNVLGDPV